MKKSVRLAALNHILKSGSDLHSDVCLTRHLRVTEVQVLHAHGKMPLRKVTCEKDSTTRHERKEEGGGSEE